MRLLLDSSIFISFFNDEDILHNETTKLIKTLLEEKELVIIIPVLIFLEVANTITKKTGKFNERQLFKIFGFYETIDLDLEFASSLIPMFKELNLKTSDAIIAATAKLTASWLITWDQKLQKAAQKIVTTQTPIEFLHKA